MDGKSGNHLDPQARERLAFLSTTGQRLQMHDSPIKRYIKQIIQKYKVLLLCIFKYSQCHFSRGDISFGGNTQLQKYK